MMQDWKGNWIWLESAPEDATPQFMRCRKIIEIAELPTAGRIEIACSGVYRLFINGQVIGRGPVHSTPDTKQVDLWNLTEHLRGGRNLVALELVHFGHTTGHSPAVPAGLFAQVSLDNEWLAADETWRLSLDPCYDATAPDRNAHYGPIEVFDARLDSDWRDNPEFDDSDWSSARILRDDTGRGGPNLPPWRSLQPRRIPPCRETPLMPEKVERVAEVMNQEFTRRTERLAFELPHYLLLDIPVEPRHTRIEKPDNMLRNDDCAAVVVQPSPLEQNQPEQFCATVIIDFGREITGYGWFEVDGNAGAVIDAVYGERMIGGRVPSILQNTAYNDRYILRDGRQRHQAYDWKGFRYLQLTFRELTRPLKIHAVGATFTSYPVEPEGLFECNDPEMTRIWQVGAYTQQLCSHDRLMDCPWREQREWLGDGRVQLLVLQNAFGAHPLIENFVRNFAESQKQDGRLPPVSFEGMKQFNDYSLWWIQAVLDAMLITGNQQLAADMLPHIERLLAWFAAFTNAEGLLENVPEITFIDWANLGRAGICAPLNAIYRIALDAGAAVAVSCGRPDLAEEWQDAAGKIAANFHDRFWADTRKLYVDNVENGEPSTRFSQHTQAIAVVAGLHPGSTTELMRRTLNDESLVRTEPYFSFYLCEALGLAGMAGEAFAYIRQQWGRMLDHGATTFWEEWQVSGTFRDGRWLARPRSHCHAWSAAPTAWLSRYVLGVRPTSIDGPLIIAPQTCGLSAAKGTVPTSHGPLTVEWQVLDQTLQATLTIPPDLACEFRNPPEFNEKTEVQVKTTPRAPGHIAEEG